MGKTEKLDMPALAVNLGNAPNHVATDDALWLATRLKLILGNEDQVVLFTSPAHGSGVSAVAAQTALATGLMGAGNVLLVDANPHGAAEGNSASSTFGVSATPGLADILSRSSSLEQAVVKTSVPTLDVLPVGKVGDDVIPPLLSEDCTKLFESLREQYRFIFVDAPPLMQYPETVVFAPCSDGVLLVVPSGRMNRSSVLAAKKTIDALNVPLLGWVLCDKTGRLKV